MIECEFCGYEFPEELGRYGCPDCEAEPPSVACRICKGSGNHPRYTASCDECDGSGRVAA